MSHDLDFTTGRAAIAYRGQTPWHGFGITIGDDDDVDTIREKAGLSFDVISAPVQYRVDQQHLGTIPLVPADKVGQFTVGDRVMLLRSDTYAPLSMVSDQYHVVQPATVFNFFTKLLAKDGLKIETAGALRNGARIWACAKVDAGFEIFGRDRIDPYLIMATSYDLSMCTSAYLSAIRPVCNNTITASGAYKTETDANSFRVPHNRAFDIDEAHGHLGLDLDAWKRHCVKMDNLARFHVTPEQALEFFWIVADQGDQIVRNPDSGAVLSFPEPTRVVKQFINAYKNGPGAELPSANGTAFGLLNAVTYYQDHQAPATDNGKRFDSATFGSGNARKQHALGLALKMLEVA